MARTNTYTCKTCGTTYEFCLRCQIARPDYDAENFCSKDHDEIYAILSKHGCNLITADEAIKELAAHNIDNITLTEDVLAHVKKIKSEAGVKIKTQPIVKETVDNTVVKSAEKTANKNNKKKW